MSQFQKLPYVLPDKLVQYVQPNVVSSVYNLYEVNVQNPKPVFVSNTTIRGFMTTRALVPKDKDFILFDSEYIGIEQVDNGVKLINRGVNKIIFKNTDDSGLIVTNQGTDTNPEFKLSVDRQKLIQQLDVVKGITVNGYYVAPNNSGIANIEIQSPNSQSFKSPKNTVSIVRSSLTLLNFDVRGILVNGREVAPNTDGFLYNLIDSDTVSVNIDIATSKIKLDTKNIIKTIKDSTGTELAQNNGVVTLPSQSQNGHAYNGSKTLVDLDVTNLNSGNGFNISTVVPTGGSTAPEVTNNDMVVLFLEGSMIYPQNVTRNGNLIKLTGVTPITGNKLGWIIIKNNS